MKKIISAIMSAALVALMFIGCKPTERNYQQAYDAALRQREKAVQEQMLPATGLLSDDGPQLRIVDGDSIFVLRERIFREGERHPLSGWAVAVGKYKMATNARANAETLREEGVTEAIPVRAAAERWYAVAAVCSTLDSARMAVREFRASHPGYPYVGLPGSPVIIGR